MQQLYDGHHIVVIDYGMGNIGSICNMIKYVGNTPVVSSDVDVIAKATKLILPGVGHFDKAMDNILNLGLLEIIRYKATTEKTPVLGICLGMQLMCQSSEEGTKEGLALIDADVKRFTFPHDEKMKVPHMGWNHLSVNKPSRLLANMDKNSRFYFVHSYYVSCKRSLDVLSYTEYGLPFVSAFELDNIVGVQFHPEKSHRFGITLFKNFLETY